MFKKIGISFLAIFLLIITGIIAVFVVVDPNSYKPLIVKQVKEMTGHDLSISGDIEWNLYPNLGFKIGATQLHNLDGFSSKNLLSFKKAQLSISLMPLLSHSLEVDKLVLEDASINIEKNKNGIINFSKFIDTNKSIKNSQATSKNSNVVSNNKDVKFTIKKMSFKNANFFYHDAQTDKLITIANLNWDVGNLLDNSWGDSVFEGVISANDWLITVNSFTRLNLDWSNNTLLFKDTNLAFNVAKNNTLKKNLDISIDVLGSIKFKEKEVDLRAIEGAIDNFHISANGKLFYKNKPNLVAHISTNNLNLDAFIEKFVQTNANLESSNTKTAVMHKKKFSTTEPDLTFMHAFDCSIDLNIPQLHFKNLDLQHYKQKSVLKNSILTLSDIHALAYQGEIFGKVILDTRKTPVRYSVFERVVGVQIRPVLTNFANIDFISGATQATTNIVGSGLSEYRLRKNIEGRSSIVFTDGALYGVNIPKKIREYKAVLQGKANSFSDTAEKTDFSELITRIDINSGIANITEFKMVSPLIRINGKGHVNLLQENMNVSLNTTLVASLQGQGSDKNINLAGIIIPVTISGPWVEPRYSFDFSKILKSTVTKKLKDKVSNKLNARLKNLLSEKDSEKLSEKLINKLF